MKIIVNTTFKPKFLFKNKVFYCQLGSKGKVPKFRKKEADKCTPLGKWKIAHIFVRHDKTKMFFRNKRIKNFSSLITEKDIWCDDSNNLNYNKLCKVKNLNEIPNFSFEKLYRIDNAYDIIINLNYNQNPTIKNKGSAIFIHCSFEDNRSTAGCLALKKNNLKFIINNLQKINYIYIR